MALTTVLGLAVILHSAGGYTQSDWSGVPAASQGVDCPTEVYEIDAGVQGHNCSGTFHPAVPSPSKFDDVWYSQKHPNLSLWRPKSGDNKWVVGNWAENDYCMQSVGDSIFDRGWQLFPKWQNPDFVSSGVSNGVTIDSVTVRCKLFKSTAPAPPRVPTPVPKRDLCTCVGHKDENGFGGACRIWGDRQKDLRPWWRRSLWGDRQRDLHPWCYVRATCPGATKVSGAKSAGKPAGAHNYFTNCTNSAPTPICATLTVEGAHTDGPQGCMGEYHLEQSYDSKPKFKHTGGSYCGERAELSSMALTLLICCLHRAIQDAISVVSRRSRPVDY